MDKLLELFAKRKKLTEELAELTEKIKAAATEEELAQVENEQKKAEEKLAEIKAVEKEISEEIAKIEVEEKSKSAEKAEEEAEEKSEPEIKTNSKVTTENVCETKKENEQMKLTTREKIQNLVLREKEAMQNFASDMKKYQKRDLLGAQFAVPAQIIDVVVDLLKEHDVLSAVDMKNVKGYARVAYFSEFPEAYWTDKSHEKSETKKIYTMDLDGYGLANYLALDAYQEEDLSTYITVVVEALAESISTKLEEAIFTGDGSNCPAGIKTYVAATSKPDYYNEEKQGKFVAVNKTNVKTVAVYGKGADGYKELAKQLVNLKKHAGSKEISLAMTEATFKKLMLELTSSDAGFNAVLANPKKELPLMGKVLFTEKLADDNVVVGYFDTYKLPVRDEIKIERSTHFEFADNKVCYRATMRADGRPMFGDAFMDITLTKAEAAASSTGR